MKYFISFILVLVLVFGFVSCGSNTNKQSKAMLSETNDSITTPTTNVNDNTIDADIGNYHLTYLRHGIETDYEGNPCLTVYFSFTNNSDKAGDYFWSISDKAFQGGIQLEKATLSERDNEVVKNNSLQIRNGATLEVCSSFSLRDTTSEVEIEVEEFLSLDNTGRDTMTIALGA